MGLGEEALGYGGGRLYPPDKGGQGGWFSSRGRASERGGRVIYLPAPKAGAVREPPLQDAGCKGSGVTGGKTARAVSHRLATPP